MPKGKKLQNAPCHRSLLTDLRLWWSPDYLPSRAILSELCHRITLDQRSRLTRQIPI
jgi:hypothetical protein